MPPLCELIPRYASHTTPLPWQTKSILIMLIFLLKCSDLPCFGTICGFEISVEIVKNVTKIANQGKMGPVDAVKRSKNVVEIGGFYYSGILA